MEMWTKNKAGHWKKRKIKNLGKMISIGGLRGYIKERKEAAKTFNNRWIVFDRHEIHTLSDFAMTIFGHSDDSQDNVIRLLDLATVSVNHASVVRVTSRDGFLHVAVRIQ